MTLNFSIIDLINFFFIAVGIGICGLCFLQISSSVHLKKEIRWYFQSFFLLIILYISSHLARQLMDGVSGDAVRMALQTVTFIEMLTAGFMAFMISMLILAASKAEEAGKRIQIVLGVLLCAHVVILVIGLFSGLVYYFDGSNTYHRGSGYLLSNLCPLVMLVVDVYLLCRYRKSITGRIRTAFWIYLIAPIIAIIIQGFTYGIQFIILATVGAAVYMFSVIIRVQNDEYAHQQEVATRL